MHTAAGQVIGNYLGAVFKTICVWSLSINAGKLLWILSSYQIHPIQSPQVMEGIPTCGRGVVGEEEKLCPEAGLPSQGGRLLGQGLALHFGGRWGGMKACHVSAQGQVPDSHWDWSC